MFYLDQAVSAVVRTLRDRSKALKADADVSRAEGDTGGEQVRYEEAQAFDHVADFLESPAGYEDVKERA